MHRFLLLLIATAFAISGFAQVDEYNLPAAVQDCLKNKKLSDLELNDRINPFFLRGDFNGDGKMDYAVLVSQRATGKQGIAICLAGQPSPIVIGAGRSFAF